MEGTHLKMGYGYVPRGRGYSKKFWVGMCCPGHALIIIITFVIKMYVYKMTCMIQYPCSKHASSPSLPHQAMLVYTCLSFIPSALSSTTLILGSGEQRFYTKCPNSFVQDCIQRLKKLSTKIRKCLVKSKRAVGIA